jgi:hypothetical protein
MAVAARPGPSDARVPCPLCGGAIHPIAGRCKHCKADLSTYRSTRPAASAPLPSLQPVVVPAPNGHAPSGPSAHASVGHAHTHGPNGHANGHAPAPSRAAYTTPVAVAAAHDVQSVLPPRPTSRSHTAEPTGSTWRSWPVIVIVVAMLAIVVAVVLMLWPSDRDRAGEPDKRALRPPPAPEHMLTEPDLKPPAVDRRKQPTVPRANAAPDPWDSTPSQPAPTPRPDPSTAPQAAPRDPNDSDDDDVDAMKDPFGGAGKPSPSHGRRAMLDPTSSAIAMAMFTRVCRKLNACNIDNQMLTDVCNQIASHPQPAPPNCPAAKRCLQQIDGMSCTAQLSSFAQLASMMMQFQDCAEAARC